AAAVREVVASDVWQRRGDGRVDGDSGGCWWSRWQGGGCCGSGCDVAAMVEVALWGCE
ncbi:hypothetical protein Tco_0689058, partial [Tanacetum coccineum]